MLANPVRDESLGHDVRSEAVNRDGHRLCHTNGVCQLNFHPVRKVCANDVLCDLPRHVGSRAINLGGVFAAEGTAAMSADTAVSIGDNLSACHTSIGKGTADHKSPGGIDQHFEIGVQAITLCGVLPVDNMGIVQAEALQSALSDNILLVSTMLANNEIGTIEPVAELAEIVHQAGALFHTDAVQAIGHIPVDAKKLDVDMLSASAHKFNGPKGIGFLYVRKGVNLVPLLDGGGQEQGMRAGTESVAGIVGMAAALQEHMEQLTQETEYLNELSNRLIDQLKRKELDFRINGSHNRIPGSLSLSFKSTDGEMLLHRLDLMGTAVATGSACNSKDTVLSHVIQAISVPQEYAHGTIRVTLGMDNTVEQVDRIAQQIASILR